MLPLPLVVVPPEVTVPDEVRVPVAVGIRFSAVVTAFWAVLTAAPGSPQELREMASAVRAVHWMKRFMWGKNDNRRRRVKQSVTSGQTFFCHGWGISSTLRTLTGCQASATGHRVRVILVPFGRVTSPTLVAWKVP